MSPTISIPKRDSSPSFVVSRAEVPDGSPRSPGLDLTMGPLRSASIRSLDRNFLSLTFKRKSSPRLRFETDSDPDSPSNKEKRASRAATPEPLPDDRHHLDGLLNYHLGELVRLKPMVVRLNEDIDKHLYKARSAEHRKEGSHSSPQDRFPFYSL